LFNPSAICFEGIEPNKRPSSPALAFSSTTVSSFSKNPFSSFASSKISASCFSCA